MKGSSSKEDVGELMMFFRKLVIYYRLIVYVDRVSTDANIDDGCSRGSRRLAHRLGGDRIRSYQSSWMGKYVGWAWGELTCSVYPEFRLTRFGTPVELP